MAKFEVSAEWMKACGMGDKAKVFDVVASYDRGFMPFVELYVDKYRPNWVVNAEWRGKFV